MTIVRDSVPRWEGEVGRVLDCLPRDLFVLFVVEWEDSAEEEVADDAQAPEVDLLSVWFLQQNLWCNVRKRAEWIETRLVWSNDLGETEVYYFEVRFLVVRDHEDVFRLQVSVGYAE